MSSSDPCNCESSQSNALELRAWRFLATHRVGSLSVTHVTFIDGDDCCRVNTPSFAGYYESARGSTFGEAAIALALALGMACTDSDEARRGSGQGESSAGTAANGGSESSTPVTPAALAASTIAATGAAPSTGTKIDLGQHAEGANLAHVQAGESASVLP